MQKSIDSESGLTADEQTIMDHLIDAWGVFSEIARYDINHAGLRYNHPDHVNEFRFHLHELQRLVAMRVVRREYPEYWGLNIIPISQGVTRMDHGPA